MKSDPTTDGKQPLTASLLFRVCVGVAVALCVLCCTLILLIPTQSISVDTVYQGF